jgi:hypothetical protein
MISKILNFVALNKIFYVPFKLLHGKFQATTTLFCATVITFDGCSGHRSRWRSTLLPGPPAAIFILCQESYIHEVKFAESNNKFPNLRE